MTQPDQDRLRELQDLGRTVSETAHENLPRETIESLRTFVDEVESHLEARARAEGARKLLAFWEAFVRSELEETGEQALEISAETIDTFERAFDQDVMGVDLYQALETLAIVANMPEEETEGDRLEQWATRVHSLTAEFLAHLEGHGE